MFNPALLFGLSAAFARLVSAKGLIVNVKNPPANCVLGCNDAVGLVGFIDMDPEGTYYGSRCSSKLYTTSLALCAEAYCTPREQQKGWAMLGSYCFDYGAVVLQPYEDCLASVDRDSVTLNVNTLAQTGTIYNNTILVDQATASAGTRTENAWSQQMIDHHAFGWAIYIFVGLAVIVGAMNRLFCVFVRRYANYSPETASAAPSKQRSWSRWYTLYRKHIEMPAMFGYKHSQASAWGWLSIPTRLQGIFIFLYVAINIIFTCVGYDVFDVNLYYYGTTSPQLQRYLADRTGIMAFYNMPLLWCLAGRNDVILWLTGWSYTSLNLLHRWVSRVTVAQAIIHSVAYTVLEKDSLALAFTERYWVTGVVATILMSLMLPLSVRPFRERYYEIFLLIHIVFALASLVTLWYHVYIMDGEYDPYIWACVAVWGLDRFVRVCRVLILTYKALSKKGKNTTATMSPIALGQEDSNGLIRLSLETSIKIVPKAGEYFFLYTPFSLQPWENHPFTLASWQVNDKTNSTTLEFLVSPLKGATKRWQKKVLKRGDRTTQFRLLLEGPYGSSHPVEMYDRVLFVAGGSGITSALPYLFRLRQIAARVPEPITREITLVWIVKDRHYAADVLAHELKEFIQDASHGLPLKIKMYVTRENGATPAAVVDTLAYAESNASHQPASASGSGSVSASDSASTSSHGTPETGSSAVMEKQDDHDLELKTKANGHVVGKSSSSALTITPGRPDICSMLRESIDQLVGGERLAISACGPAGMVDDTRRAVCDLYGDGEDQVSGKTVEYFEELFSW